MTRNKKDSERDDSAAPAEGKRPLSIDENTLKDLAPSSRATGAVKGGIPPKFNPRATDAAE